MDHKLQGAKFEILVQAALEAMEFKVDRDVTLAGCQVDLLATKKLELEDRVYLVECKDLAKPTGVNALRNFKSLVDAANNEILDCAGMFVSRLGFTKEAKKFAKTTGIILKTYVQLTETTFNSIELAQATILEFSDLEASKVYVDLSCQTGEFRAGTVYKPVEKFLNKFLPDTKRPGCAVLGDFGSGKTSLSFSYAAKMAKSWLKKPGSCYLPVVIRLRNLDDFSDLKLKIFKEINAKLPSGTTLHGFERALDTTSFLFVLDGLDEIATRWDEHTLRLNLEYLNRFFKHLKNSRFILTCRTHFFRTRVDEELIGSLIRLYVRSWGQEELNDYVYKSRPSSAEETVGVINSTYNLEELSKTPIFLKMITETIDEFDGQVDHAQLYRVYTDKWIKQEDSRSSMRPSEKRSVMEAIALRMMTENKLHISHDSELQSLVANHFGVNDYMLVRKLDQDVRTCSFLIRDELGDYFFVHKSYMEYFVGCVLAREIQANDFSRMKERDYGNEVAGFVACFFRNDWRGIAKIIHRSSNSNLIANALSIASHLDPNDRFERVIMSALHAEDDVIVRSRALECLASWATDNGLSELVDTALDSSDSLRGRALELLSPFMDKPKIGDKFVSMLEVEKFDAICADVVDCARELHTAKLKTAVLKFSKKTFWKDDKRTVYSVMRFFEENVGQNILEDCKIVLGYVEVFSEEEFNKFASAMYFKFRGAIIREIRGKRKSGMSHQNIEGGIHAKYGAIVSGQNIGPIIQGVRGLKNRARDNMSSSNH